MWVKQSKKSFFIHPNGLRDLVILTPFLPWLISNLGITNSGDRKEIYPIRILLPKIFQLSTAKVVTMMELYYIDADVR